MTRGECLLKALNEVFQFDKRPDLYSDILDCDPNKLYTTIHDTCCPDGRGGHMWSLTIIVATEPNSRKELLHASVPERDMNQFRLLFRKYCGEALQAEQETAEELEEKRYVLQVSNRLEGGGQYINLRTHISEKLLHLIEFLVANDY